MFVVYQYQQFNKMPIAPGGMFRRSFYLQWLASQYGKATSNCTIDCSPSHGWRYTWITIKEGKIHKGHAESASGNSHVSDCCTRQDVVQGTLTSVNRFHGTLDCPEQVQSTHVRHGEIWRESMALSEDIKCRECSTDDNAWHDGPRQTIFHGGAKTCGMEAAS